MGQISRWIATVIFSALISASPTRAFAFQETCGWRAPGSNDSITPLVEHPDRLTFSEFEMAFIEARLASSDVSESSRARGEELLSEPPGRMAEILRKVDRSLGLSCEAPTS